MNVRETINASFKTAATFSKSFILFVVALPYTRYRCYRDSVYLNRTVIKRLKFYNRCNIHNELYERVLSFTGGKRLIFNGTKRMQNGTIA